MGIAGLFFAPILPNELQKASGISQIANYIADCAFGLLGLLGLQDTPTNNQYIFLYKLTDT